MNLALLIAETICISVFSTHAILKNGKLFQRTYSVILNLSSDVDGAYSYIDDDEVNVRHNFDSDTYQIFVGGYGWLDVSWEISNELRKTNVIQLYVELKKYNDVYIVAPIPQ